MGIRKQEGGLQNNIPFWRSLYALIFEDHGPFRLFSSHYFHLPRATGPSPLTSRASCPHKPIFSWSGHVHLREHLLLFLRKNGRERQNNFPVLFADVSSTPRTMPGIQWAIVKHLREDPSSAFPPDWGIGKWIGIATWWYLVELTPRSRPV